MAREVLGPAAAAARLVFTPLFGDDHLQVKALAALQVPQKSPTKRERALIESAARRKRDRLARVCAARKQSVTAR